MQGNANNNDRRYGHIMLVDAYEVHEFIVAQDMFTIEDAIDLVVQNNQALDRVIEISASVTETTLKVMKQISGILLDLQDNAEEPVNLPRVGQGRAVQAIVTHTQTTPNPQAHCLDGNAITSPPTHAAKAGSLAPSFLRTGV